MLNAKELVREQIIEIEVLCEDLRYIKDKELRNNGIDRIRYIAQKIEENLEYLEAKQTTGE